MFEHVGDIVSPAAIHGLAFSTDSCSLAITSQDKRARIYDRATRELGHTAYTGAEFMNAVAFDPAGERLATGRNSLWMFDTATGKRIKSVAFEKFKTSMAAMAFTQDGKRLWIAGSKSWRADGFLVCLDLTTGDKVADASLAGAFRALVLAPEGDLIGAVTTDEVFVVESATATVRQRWATRNHPWNVRFAPDGRSLWLSQRLHPLQQFDVVTGEKCGELETSGYTYGFAFDPLDSNVVITACRDRGLNGRAWVEAYDITSGASRWSSTISEPADAHKMAISPDGQTLVAALHRLAKQTRPDDTTVPLDHEHVVRVWKRLDSA